MPRPLVALSATALVAGTGAALWFLPAEARPEWAAPASVAQPKIIVQPVMVARTPEPRITAEAPQPATAPEPVRAGGPSGFVTFVDAVHHPRFDLPATARRTGVRWYTIGHLTAGQDGCTPKWGGVVDQSRNPVANRIARLRAQGGEAGLAFGGPSGDELSATCDSETRLLAAYRRVVGAFGLTTIDFEVRDSADAAATRRRAAAIVALQRDARENGRPLAVSFTLPAAETGISPADRDMVRATREAGAEISTVNLLVPFKPAADGNVARTMTTAKAAHAQIGWALGATGRSCWQRMGVTPVLVSAQDLSLDRARRLVDFQAKEDLALLSVRGARPADAVSRLLGTSPS